MRMSDWSSDVCSSDRVAGGHRDEQSQRKAERADEERHQLDHGDQPQQPPGRAVRDEEREEMQAVAPETDDQDDREAQDRKKTGDREVARHGERRSEEHTSELQSLMRISYAVFCLKKKTKQDIQKKQKPMTALTYIQQS